MSILYEIVTYLSTYLSGLTFVFNILHLAGYVMVL